MACRDTVRLAGLLLALCASLRGQIGGRVVVGGSAPPEPVQVTVSCGESHRWEGYSDKKGEFIAYLGFENPRPGRVDCRVETALSGFWPGLASVDYLPASHVLVTLYPVSPGHETTIGVADAAAPAKARKQFDRGLQELRSKHWKSAESDVRKAIAIYPGYASAWNELGFLLEKTATADDACAAYARAIELDSRMFSAYARWAAVNANRKRWDSVAATTAAALKFNPSGWPVLYFYRSVAEFNLGRLMDAEQSARHAVAESGEQLPRSHYILGRILAGEGHYREAVQEMSKYLDLMGPFAEDATEVRAQIEDARAHM